MPNSNQQPALQTALAVDDDPIVLLDVCDILADAGFECLTAHDGDAAIAQLEQRAKDITLLFSDVEMPGSTDGFALAHRARKNWDWIEVVLASGRVKPHDGDLPDGVTFLSKPFNARTVHEHLASSLPDEKKPEPLTRQS